MSDHHKTAPRSRAVVIHEGRVLLMRRVKNGSEYYCFPGGMIEAGESPEAAAVRETKEETNIDIAVESLLCETMTLGRREYYYRASYRGGHVQLGGEEKERMSEKNQFHPQWYPLADALQMQNLLPHEVVAQLRHVDDPEHRLGTSKPIQRTARDHTREMWWITLASAALIALFYVTIVSPFFHLQKTSPSATQQQTTSLVTGEQLVVPLHIVLLTGREYGSERTDASIAALVENASRIWEQARIQFSVAGQEEFPISPDDYADLQYKPMTFVQKISGEVGAKTVVLIKELRGLNGVSYDGTNTVFVADYTSRPDFRVLAHELGHQLGLDHTNNTPSNLMDEDAAGVTLTQEQVGQARSTASAFINAE